MSKTEMINVTKLQSEFLQAFQRGLEALEEAGKILVDLLAADPTARERLVADHGFDHGTLATMEKIGRGQLHPKLASFGVRYASLPMSEQKRIAEGKVDALVVKPDGSTDVLKVSVLRAPAEIREQLVNGDHIRTLDEQKAFLAARAGKRAVEKAAEKLNPEAMPWHVKGSSVMVLRPTVLTRRDLLAMLQAIGG